MEASCYPDDQRDDLEEEAYRKAFEAWGVLEIINATLLDEDRPPAPQEKQDVNRLLDEFCQALATGLKE
ncbi:hypothetical protein [Propionibacterium australiense]|nr:hypothetical protein [Propionibacterium australiense]RLP06356.1 hypothetical protein D9T14_12390 [Propionibacterium australiense]